jgi:hypothetical protein
MKNQWLGIACLLGLAACDNGSKLSGSSDASLMRQDAAVVGQDAAVAGSDGQQGTGGQIGSGGAVAFGGTNSSSSAIGSGGSPGSGGLGGFADAVSGTGGTSTGGKSGLGGAGGTANGGTTLAAGGQPVPQVPRPVAERPPLGAVALAVEPAAGQAQARVWQP